MTNELLADVLVEIARSADWAGGLVLVNGHGGNRAGVDAAVRRITDDGRAVLSWWPRVEGGDAHAGRTETSIMLALAPDAVRLEHARPRVRRSRRGSVLLRSASGESERHRRRPDRSVGRRGAGAARRLGDRSHRDREPMGALCGDAIRTRSVMPDRGRRSGAARRIAARPVPPRPGRRRRGRCDSLPAALPPPATSGSPIGSLSRAPSIRSPSPARVLRRRT